jgi:hypothetical protein
MTKIGENCDLPISRQIGAAVIKIYNHAKILANFNQNVKTGKLVLQTHPPICKEVAINFSHFLCTKCLSPEWGSFQVLFAICTTYTYVLAVDGLCMY